MEYLHSSRLVILRTRCRVIFSTSNFDVRWRRESWFNRLYRCFSSVVAGFCWAVPTLHKFFKLAVANLEKKKKKTVFKTIDWKIVWSFCSQGQASLEFFPYGWLNGNAEERVQINLAPTHGLEYQIPIEQGDLIQKRNTKQPDRCAFEFMYSRESCCSLKESSKELRECIPEVRFQTQKSEEGWSRVLKLCFHSICKFQGFLQ